MTASACPLRPTSDKLGEVNSLRRLTGKAGRLPGRRDDYREGGTLPGEVGYLPGRRDKPLLAGRSAVHLGGARYIWEEPLLAGAGAVHPGRLPGGRKPAPLEVGFGPARRESARRDG